MKILLAYFSATQNTARIAEAIQKGLVEQGARVEVLDITQELEKLETSIPRLFPRQRGQEVYFSRPALLGGSASLSHATFYCCNANLHLIEGKTNGV